MSRKILETNSDRLNNFEKHKLLIVRDHKNQSRQRIIGVSTFASGFLGALVLYNINQFSTAIFLIFISTLICVAVFLWASRCPICDKFFSSDTIQDRISNDQISFCRNCKLTDAQMDKYIDMLARNVEINEQNVRKVFEAK